MHRVGWLGVHILYKGCRADKFSYNNDKLNAWPNTVDIINFRVGILFAYIRNSTGM